MEEGHDGKDGNQTPVVLHFNRRHHPLISSVKQAVGVRMAQAKFKGFAWKLTLAQAAILIGGNCHYCGSEPAVHYNSRVYQNGYTQRKSFTKEELAEGDVLLNGIDRLDSTKGYVLGNVVPCCRICNFAKNDLTVEEFEQWLNRLVKFRLSRK